MKAGTAYLEKGSYRARFALGQADVQAALELRALCFRGPETAGRSDRDEFDARCQHVLIEEQSTGQLVCCFRLMLLKDGGQIEQTYSAKYYGLSGLQSFRRPMAELGRFCIHPDFLDADILRVAWGALTRFVDAQSIGMLFGCSSFAGTDPKPYQDAFGLLRAKHLAPDIWRPKAKAKSVLRFGADVACAKPDLRRALKGLPPLLRTYLAMGGWVSDHAVIDHDLDRLHVFTGLDVNSVPSGRQRILRAIST